MYYKKHIRYIFTVITIYLINSKQLSDTIFNNHRGAVTIYYEGAKKIWKHYVSRRTIARAAHKDNPPNPALINALEVPLYGYTV